MKLSAKLSQGTCICLFLLCAAAAQKAPTIDVGVLVPTEVVTGETLSASIVTNPRDFAGIAGLRVIPAQLPRVTGGDTANPLHDYLIDGIPGRSPQPADQPFTFAATPNLMLQVKSARPGSGPQVNVSIPVSFPGGVTPRSFEGFRMPPISLPGAMQLIRGPFSGDRSTTSVEIGSNAARIWCESPRALYFNIPANTPIGANLVTINDRGHKTRLKTWALALAMSADRLKLKRGESTAFHVLIKGVETIPYEAWFGNGEVPELTDPSLVSKFLPGFKPPSTVQPGVLVLTLENMSSETVAMSGGDRIALRFTYGEAKYEHHGTITAKRAGGFDIDGTLIPFLHDQPGEGLPGDNVPKGPDTAAAGELFRRAQQWRQLAGQVQDDAAKNNAGQDDSTRKNAENTVKNCNTTGDRLDQIAHNAEDNAVKNPLPLADISPTDRKLIQHFRESAKFWRDEAKKARQWAKEATDEKTKKVWEEQAKWQDDNAQRREDLANDLEKKGGKTIVKNDPPPPPVPATPETPVAHGPGSTPPPVAQNPPATPQQTTDKTRSDDCPQRGKGCVALIIDFSYDQLLEVDLKNVSDKLKAAKCDVDYVIPSFKPVPEGYLIGYESGTATQSPDDKEITANKEHNKDQWNWINDAIAMHRQRVAKGAEIAIELVNGHGGEARPGLDCGDFEPADWSGKYLRRDDFHLGNYRAANKNVCSWFTADFTCYGGLTPKAVDELNNLTTATCTNASTIACGNHAGWEADSSMSSATDTKTCNNGNIWWQKGYIKDALDAEIKRREAGQSNDYSQLIKALQSDTVSSATAHYSDRGYDKDKPPIHAREGYDLQACTGGSCR